MNSTIEHKMDGAGLSSGTTLKLLITIAAFTAVICYTRISSTIISPSKASEGGQRVPLIPYWVPFLGHALDLGLRPNALLHGMRSSFPHGIASMVLVGSSHNMIWSPSLAQAIFSQRSTVIDFGSIIWYILVNIGGIPRKYEEQFTSAYPQFNAAIINFLLKEPTLSQSVRIAVKNFEETLPKLVTFADRPIDQTQWERLADASLVTDGGEKAMEVDLLPLIINVTGHCSLASIWGTDLHRNYPDILSDLWAFNRGFLLLAAGLPRWLPIPGLGAAYAARSRLVDALADLQRALDAELEGRDPGSRWDDVESISKMIKDRHIVYRDQNIPPPVRAAADLSILWAMNANSNFLIFWILVRILSDDELTAQIRKETSPFVTIEQLPSEFGPGIHEPPILKLDEKGLSTHCPLLKSCYIESLRLDSAPWSLKKVLKDVTITESMEDCKKRGESTPESYHLKSGSYADVPFDLHFTDSKYFRDPLTFIPDRHIVTDEKDGSARAEFNTVRPYGGGRTMCKGRVYAEKECLTMIAGLLALWDFEPVDKAGWKIPRPGKATAVNMPKDNVRVRLRRRTIRQETSN